MQQPSPSSSQQERATTYKNKTVSMTMSSTPATRNAAANNNTSTSGGYWSLSVKAIGSALKNGADDEESSSTLFSGEKNFTVTVSPEDTLTTLYDQIEDATGLKASQQRLIYRGRLIENSEVDNNNNNNSNNSSISRRRRGKPDDNNDDDDRDGSTPSAIGTSGDNKEDESLPKIKDIVGLCDGHTIHLVKRQESRDSNRDSNNNNNNPDSTTLGSSTSPDRDETFSGSGTASLLAALIGLGGLDDGDSNDAPATTTTTGRQRVGWRSRSRRNRPNYRLTAEDLQTPDPGTLEPVRQGLMTIHTMLPHARAQSNEEGELYSPLDANRRWYRGQWIDVRDTVNQWLEATIVEILTPDEILPPKEADRNDNNNNSNVHRNIEGRRPQILEPATDPAVSAGDMEGRRRLLLEPCDIGDEGDEGGELAGFRRRKSNAGVQILLIHYNGWPHRWDEWIRSDSERIRPFRTRTRHPSMASHSSPTTQSTYNESPPTHIVDEDNGTERPAMLPELSRAVAAVNELLSAVAAEEATQLITEQQQNLPWAVRVNSTRVGGDVDNEEDLDALPPLSGDDGQSEDYRGDTSLSTTATAHSSTQPRLRRRQLQMLAPLLDRLGRTLIDAAPHVAALANTHPDFDTEESISTAEAVIASEPEDESNPSTLGGLLSLLSRDRRRQNTATVDAGNTARSSSSNEHTWPVDPDYVDFATGSVNTSRGEVRSGPRSRSSNDDVAGLLGAYLAAASLGLPLGVLGGGAGDADGSDEGGGNVLGLGRLLRDRGGGGGGNGAGIDIHIHAVVTAPGMPPTAIGGGGTGAGGLGFAMLGATPTTPAISTRNSLSPASRERRGSGGSSLLRLRTPTVVEEEDDLGLFSDLYSESPDPVDPNGSPEAVRDDGLSASDNAFLSLLNQPARGAGTAYGASRHEQTSALPRRLNRSNSDASSRRSSTNGNSPRRGSMFGRLFRRSRRSSGGSGT